MGYTTTFKGAFKIIGSLTKPTVTLVNGLNQTRRVQRDPRKLAEKLGISHVECLEKYKADCQFYVDAPPPVNPWDVDSDVLDNNCPPDDQPCLWLCWRINEQSKELVWDEIEKASGYVDWLIYLNKYIFKPADLKLEGSVRYFGEREDDKGIIECVDNEVIHYGEIRDKEYRGSGYADGFMY